jgi:hypothetical protein
MSTSVTISITQSCTWSGCYVQSKILNIHLLLIHVSETYNTIMSLRQLGISVDVHIELFDNSPLINSC